VQFVIYKMDKLISYKPRWFFVSATLLILACSQGNLVETIRDDTVVAEINGDTITGKELRDEVNLLMKQFRVNDLEDLSEEEKHVLKINGLNRIIKNILLNMEAVHSRVVVTRKEYKNALNAVKNEYQGDSFNKYLEVEGIPLDAWENKFKNNMLIKKLIRETVNNKALVSDDLIKSYYENHQAEFQRGERVRSLHIMVESEGEIRNILKLLESEKKDFSVLAQIHSLGPEGSMGGDLGYFEAGQMPEEFDGVFKLKIGQVSDTIKTPYGHHLFKVIDKKPAIQMTFAESKNIIYNKLLREKQSKAFEGWMLKLKNKSDIKIKYDVLAKIY